MAVLIDMILLMVVGICLYTDLSRRKIYNLVVFPAAAAGMILNSAQHGLPGLKSSAAGLGLGVLLFLLPFALGGMGAGDVKLLGAIGALKGPFFVFETALGAALAGGVIALGTLLRRRQLLGALRRIALACALFLGVRKRSGEALILMDRRPYSALFPYGAAIFIGALLAYWFGDLLAF